MTQPVKLAFGQKNTKSWIRRQPHLRCSPLLPFAAFLLAPLGLFCRPLVAEPIIQAVVPGAIAHKGSATITGTGFGAKNPAAPRMWDDIEDGIDPDWGNHGLSVNADTQRHANSTKNAVNDWSLNRRGYVSREDVNSTIWYTSWWFRFGDTHYWGDPTPGDRVSDVAEMCGWKTLRFFPNTGGQDNYCNFFYGFGADNWLTSYGIDLPQWCQFVVESGSSGDSRHNIGVVPRSQWHFIEMQYQANSAPDAADGKVKVWLNCVLISERNTMTTSTTAHPEREQHPYIIGGFHMWFRPASTSVKFHSDDIYLDTSWARVMIGDKPTWEQCTHREIQVPTAWSANSITITVNQGAFQNGTKAYLYVVDANGNVNAQVYPIMFGEAPIADLTPPFVSGQSPAPDAQNVPVNSNVVLHVQDSGDGVDVSSIAVKVNGAAVTPQISGTSSDYTVTYTPASPFAYNSTVTVAVNARDLHTPPNVMSEMSYSFKTIAGDTAAPVVTGQSPAPNAQNVPVNTSVVLHVQDSGDGVEMGSIAMTVNGAAVTPQITGTSSDYTVTYAPASPFAYDTNVTVAVNARDLHIPPNVMNQVSYSFKTIAGDTASPFVSGQSPAPNAQNVPVNTSVVLHVQDSGDGVERASIAMTVNGAAVTPQITGTSSDYTVTYAPASPFAYNATVTVTVNARDLHSPPNVMSQVSYSFRTTAGDTAPPVVAGQSPAADEQNVLVDSNIVLHVQDSGDGVDIASIQVKVNGVTVTPQITGAPSDYTVTYDPPSPFAYDSVVTVTVNARDLHSPPNVMAEVAYSFRTQPEGAVTEEWGDGSASDHPGTVEDTYINIDAANYAAEDTAINTYTWPANSAANAILMKFNLSAIPENAMVTSAKLYLYMYDASTDATYDVSAHKVINVNPVISAATGYTYDGVNPWTPHQGLYDNIPLAQSDIGPAEDTVAVDRTFGYKEWTVTNMVAEWVANPATNRGLLLNSDSNAATNAYRFFRPSEYAAAAQRPRLVVTFVRLPLAPGMPKGAQQEAYDAGKVTADKIYDLPDGD